ncbi:MAG: nucleic acid binding, partial [Paramarteilia canceri]
ALTIPSLIKPQPAVKSVEKYPKILVFMDFETSGLQNPCPTELSMLAVSTEELFSKNNSKLPRVQNKITLCFKPNVDIAPEAQRLTGMNKKILRLSPTICKATIHTIAHFLQ